MNEEKKTLNIKLIEVSKLKPHPKNYRQHTTEQIAHLVESLRVHGFYRNIVVANDNTILAGHGVVEAAKEMQIKKVPVYQVNLKAEEPKALLILAGDNEIGPLAEVNNQALSEILESIRDDYDESLLGTGWDSTMLDNLIFISRPQEETGFEVSSQSNEEEKKEEKSSVCQIVIQFHDAKQREEFLSKYPIRINQKESKTNWSTWWASEEQADKEGEE